MKVENILEVTFIWMGIIQYPLGDMHGLDSEVIVI